MAELRPKTAAAKANLRQAKALFQEVVEFTGNNMPDKYAGALENLAAVYDTTTARRPEDAPIDLAEARLLLRAAEREYRCIDDTDGVSRVQSRLVDLED